MSVIKEYRCRSLEDTSLAAEQIVSELKFPACVYLHGEMGAGKTTLCKNIINAFGYKSEVTSPTYNLIQEYPVNQGVIYHMDLYRLNDPQEIEYLAIDDLWSARALFLIEWPVRGEGRLLPADYEISISYNGDHEARKISFANTD